MIDRMLDGTTMTVLTKALSASRLSHDVMAHNLANLETPGFKRSEVLFSDRLAAALKAQDGAAESLAGLTTNERHLPIGEQPTVDGVEPQVVVRAETSLRQDGNNVDLDAEMVRMSENTLLYQALAQVVRSRLATLRSVISEGRR